MGSNVTLAHFGRKSGKRFETYVWYVEIDGHIWIGTQDVERNWVRNVRATPRVELDFGSGAEPYTAEWRDDRDDLKRFRDAVFRRHPIAARLIVWLNRHKTPGCFQLRRADGDAQETQDVQDRPDTQ